jgi:hypothetical protein
MSQNSEKVCHSAYRKSVGKMLHRQNARTQNEMSPWRASVSGWYIFPGYPSSWEEEDVDEILAKTNIKYLKDNIKLSIVLRLYLRLHIHP